MNIVNETLLSIFKHEVLFKKKMASTILMETSDKLRDFRTVGKTCLNIPHCRLAWHRTYSVDCQLSLDTNLVGFRKSIYIYWRTQK